VSEPGRRPRLVAVPGGEDPAGPGPASTPVPARSRLWLPLLLGVALALCAVALAAQSRRADRLGAQLAQTEAELARAQSRLAAWEAWRGTLRGQAERVRAELGALAAALESEPGEAPPAR
jgi:septal ring factor EnvC (AmiA/AmiB activator)